MIAKLLPGRAQAKMDAEILCDLDAILTRPVGFRFMGEDHDLSPVDLETFFEFTSAFHRLMNAPEGKKRTRDEINHDVTAMFQSVCPTVTLAMVSKMEIPQILALFSFIVDTVQGKTQAGKVIPATSKKKLTG